MGYRCRYTETMTSTQKPIRKTYANVLATMEAEVQALRDTYGFDLGSGWKQVEGAPMERIVAYGRMRGLVDMIDRLHGGYLVESGR